MAIFAQRRFAPHLRAFLLDEKRVVKDAQAVSGKPAGDGHFASF
jgi:hypothetical protein